MTENNAAQPGLNDTIRAVFLEHGFTIKHGQTDLKPYVYEAVHALLSKLRAEGVQAGDERAIDAAALLGKYKKLCIEIGRGDSYHLRRIDAAIAALANTPSAVPENWKLVPIKPTPKMMEAWYDAFNANIKSAARSTLAYRALIDAAPDALASAPVAEPYDSEQRCRAYYDSDLRPFAADGLTYNVWQAVWHAAQFDRAMYPNSSKPRPHSAPAAGEAQGVSVERLAKDPFLAAQLWRNPVDRAPVAGEAVTDDMRDAVRFAPSSAYWSRRLVEFFGPHAREGINALEKQLRVALADASAAGEATIYLDAGHLREVLAGNDMPVSASAEPGGGMVPLNAAPQASEAVPDVNALMAAEYRQWIEWFHKGRDYDDFLKECVFPKTQARATIKQSLTVAPPASEALRNAALEEAALRCEDIYSWRGAYSAGVLHQTTLDACASAIRALKTQADKDGGDCAKGAGDERAALEMLIREAQAVADDYHNPRYTRLDEAIQSARAALSPTPSVVKQSLTATQTGEKGEKDAQ